jgi:SPP1 family predicted phage head-tail adaptor
MIGPQIAAVGDRPHRVAFQNPGPPISDGDGGFTQTWTDCAPLALSVKVEAATTAALERTTAGTVIATATHLITGPFHPQLTTQSRALFNGRLFQIASVTDREERQQEMVLVCVEMVP